MSNNQNLKKINLNHIPVFVAIAETKSITAAAHLLGQEKTRVSRILSEFESDLNTELVFRTTRNLRLTKRGIVFYEQCKKTLQELEEGMRILSHRGGEISGHIRLTAAHGIASALLPSVIKEFNQLHPLVTFEIILTQQELNLVKEGIDIAFRVGELENSSYKVRKIGDAQFVFVSTPSLLTSNFQFRSIEDLENISTIVLPSFNKKSLSFKNGDEAVNLRLKNKLICNSPSLLMDLVLKDFGIGLLPEFLCRDHFKTGQLIHLFDQWHTHTVPLSLIFHASSGKNKHVALFIDLLSSSARKMYQTAPLMKGGS